MLRYAVKYKLGGPRLNRWNTAWVRMTEGYLTELSRSKRVASVEQLVDDFWDRYYARIKPWYQPESDDVIPHRILRSDGGEACRRLGVRGISWPARVDGDDEGHVPSTSSTNKAKRFRELYGPDVVIDEFYTDSKFDQPMIDMYSARVHGQGEHHHASRSRKQQKTTINVTNNERGNI